MSLFEPIFEELNRVVFAMRQLDLFVESPIDFDLLWSRSEEIPLATTSVRIASIPDLIAMKQRAGRSQDLTDIEALERILAKTRNHPVNGSGDGAADTDWQVDWEQHRIAQMTAAMQATPAQRLAWLEEVLLLAYRAGALPRPDDSSSPEPKR